MRSRETIAIEYVENIALKRTEGINVSAAEFIEKNGGLGNFSPLERAAQNFMSAIVDSYTAHRFAHTIRRAGLLTPREAQERAFTNLIVAQNFYAEVAILVLPTLSSTAKNHFIESMFYQLTNGQEVVPTKDIETELLNNPNFIFLLLSDIDAKHLKYNAKIMRQYHAWELKKELRRSSKRKVAKKQTF